MADPHSNPEPIDSRLVQDIERAKVVVFRCAETLAQLHHDLNAPVSVLALALRDETQDPELRQAARDAAMRMQRILAEMAHLVRILRPSESLADLVEILQDVANDTKSTFERSDASHGTVNVAANANNLRSALVQWVRATQRLDRVSTRIQIQVEASHVRVLLQDLDHARLASALNEAQRSFARLGKADVTQMWSAGQTITASNGVIVGPTQSEGLAADSMDIIFIRAT